MATTPSPNRAKSPPKSPASPMSPSLLSKTKGKYGGTTGRTIRESTGSTPDQHSPEKIPQIAAEQQTVSDLRRMTGRQRTIITFKYILSQSS